ncbi:MAG TPA: asparagine synthase (glutamine-hydrolyzing) [Nitrospira sp.]|nr:asparagine synthase (glutamine-hydrolyzing) [Nitrospira sp.]MBX3337337.1 asparagine synthase (glutamine-hydrolyzing) [Nitrospira sp.]MCW5780466.1 asparagine synthase (glutamine-hydrolyzing) [Nitrospira sp.]HNI67001.1 asparagine synthase (glutamine-hydrolyzing) [Nitrospira sp.]HNK15551.1 asparagine synthase (glutamine-hydrolyzing) [Nitrospira sp.]
MCGIAVVIGLNGRGIERAAVERMAESLVHRGPDDSGIYVDGPVGMGFRRLSILDLSEAGHQPMVTSDQQYVLVFNGEIFNYVELRSELRELGYQFRSSGDSEVLLAAYREWGRNCLAKLNGMWAFVIFDRRRRCLFGSRDRFGVKPLYVSRVGDVVQFASEIKALRASGYVKAGINWTTAARFLTEGRLDSQRETFYDGIEQIPPGSGFEVGLDGVWQQWSFWSLDRLPPSLVENPAERFADLFEDSVRIRMRSDVPVGVCLSGGLDSTAIICAAARQQGERTTEPTESLQAFCYMAKEFDESRYIADTLDQTRAQLRQLETSPSELWSDLKKLLWFQDEPVHTMTAVVGYQLMRLAASHGIRVVLNGQGADETIGGYSSYFQDYWVSLIRQGRMGDAWRAINGYSEAHGGSAPQRFAQAAARCVSWEMYKIPAYRDRAQARRQARLHSNSWFTHELLSHVTNGESELPMGTLSHALKQSVISAPLPLYLRIEDRNSMAHSVEARLPFLDYRLVSFVCGLPDEWKVRGPWNKYVLREGMRGRMPESVRGRVDKMGFPTASKKWFAHDLYEPLRDVLGSQAVRERGIYNAKAILADLDRHRKGEADFANRLFHVAEFELLSDVLRQTRIL